jgi:hypothetical protein
VPDGARWELQKCEDLDGGGEMMEIMCNLKVTGLSLHHTEKAGYLPAYQAGSVWLVNAGITQVC